MSVCPGGGAEGGGRGGGREGGFPVMKCNVSGGLCLCGSEAVLSVSKLKGEEARGLLRR